MRNKQKQHTTPVIFLSLCNGISINRVAHVDNTHSAAYIVRSTLLAIEPDFIKIKKYYVESVKNNLISFL